MSKEFINNNEKPNNKKHKETRKDRIKKIKTEERKVKLSQKERRNFLRSNKNSEIASQIRNKNRINIKKSITTKRIIAIVLLIVLIIGISVLIIERDSISFDNLKNFVNYGLLNNNSDERFPIDIQGTTVSSSNFDRMGSYLCYSSDSNFSVINNYGVVTYTTQISYTNPVINCTNNRCILYNLGEKGFIIVSKEETLYTGESDNEILSASINDKGCYALVTKYDGYMSKLFVYDENNSQVFTYSFADYYISSVSIDSTGSRIALCGITALNGNEISAVYVLDITKSEPIVFEEFEGEILYKVNFLGDNNCCIIGKNACYGFKVNNSEFIQTDYEGKNLTSYFINRSNNTFNVSLSRSGDGRNCTILTCNSSGKVIGTNETELRITSLSAYKGRIGAVSGSFIYTFSKDGFEYCKRDVSVEPHKIVMYTRKDAYVLGVSEISRINL